MPLPGGGTLDLRRDRWQGVLAEEEVAACRAHGIPLGYDCAQCGWVPLCVAHDEGAELAFGGAAPRRAAAEDAARVDPGPRASFLETVDGILRQYRWGSFGAEVAVERVRRAVQASVVEVYTEGGLAEADRAHWTLRVLAEDRCPLLRQGRPHPAPADPAVAFRPWRPEDVPVFRSLLGNPRVWEFLPEPYPDPFDDETARTLIELGSLDFHHTALAVVWEGTPVGQCLLRFDGRDEPRTAEVAYWLGEEHWGRGLMSRILPAFTRRSFQDHELEAIYAWIRRDHVASERVARRAGYVRDFFPYEAELAESMGRPGFVRFAAFRDTALDTERIPVD